MGKYEPLCNHIKENGKDDFIDDKEGIYYGF